MTTLFKDQVTYETYGETLATNVPVYKSTGTGNDSGRTAGRLYKLDVVTADRKIFYGITKEAGNAADTNKKVVQAGRMDGFSALTAGVMVWSSTSTPGAITQTKPTTNVQGIGLADTATSIQVNSGLGASFLGTNPDNAITSLTGDVTGTGPGATATTIANNVVSNAKLAQMPAHTVKGNNTAGTANAIDLTQTQLTAEINTFTSGLSGAVPASGGGTTNFLRADGSFQAPAGTVSASLSAADAATTYITDQAGNIYSKWEKPCQAYITMSFTDNSNDLADGAFSSNMRYLAVGTTGGAHLYRRAGNTYSLSYGDFGTGNYGGVDYQYDGARIALAKAASPFYEIYTQTVGALDAGAIAVLTTPLDTAPTGIGNGVRYKFDGSQLAIVHNTSPFVSFYTMTSGGSVGTKIANPATLPTGNGQRVEWTADGLFVTIAHTTTPFQTTYSVSGSTFTKLADPTGGNPAGNGTNCAWSPNGVYLAITHVTSPYLTVYKRTGTGGSSILTKLTIPASSSTVTSNGGVSFHPSGNWLIFSGQTAPNIEMYSIDNGTDTFTLVSKAYDVIPDIGTTANLRHSPDGEFMFLAALTTGFNADKNILFRGSVPPPVNIRKNFY